MPSFEAKLLAEFLVAPASLRDFMTLRQFTDIFPQAHRGSPVVKELYRELYTLREQDIDLVRQDIADEVKRSRQLKREYAAERRRIDDSNVPGLDPVALQMEEEITNNPRKKPHSLQSVHASIEEACETLETQITNMEEESRLALREVQEAVGGLSDLRHGRFAPVASGEDIGEEVLATLKRLEAVCANSAG